ncbi:MAG: GntR family transcriptional regulator [Hyphomicrobiaceae bacterium]|nr:GntR family transcriptional regulator [Hyphomicrobiaceae bacterium]
MLYDSRLAWSPDHAQPIGQQLYQYLRSRVIEGLMEPGSRVSEAKLAETLEVSRQPIREAFIKLAEEGLLEVRPQRGTFVRKISVRMVDDARFVREAVEADVVRMAASTYSNAQIGDLEKQVEAQENAVSGDIAGFIRLDDHFHRSLASGVGHANAWFVVEGLKAQLDRVRYLSLRQFPAADLVRQHANVVRAIATKDPDAAEKHMRLHLNHISDDLPEIARELPHFFID